MQRSPLAIIFVTVFIDLIGFGIVFPILPYYAQTFHASAGTIGVLLSIFSLMQFVMAPLWGRLSDRVGRRPVIIVALGAGMLSYIAMGLAQSLLWLFVARGIAGACGGSISAAQAYIADVTKPEDRAKGMGMIGAAFGIGFIVGPAIGGLSASEAGRLGAWLGGPVGRYLVDHKFAVPMFIAAALSGCNLIAAFIRLPESLSEEMRAKAASAVRKSRLGSLLHAIGRPQMAPLIGVFFFATFGFSMLEATFAMLVKARFRMNEANVGWIFAFIGVIAVIIQGMLMGRLQQRFGEWRLLRTGLAIIAFGMFGLAKADTIPLMLLASALVSIGNALTTPSINALISRAAAAHEQGGTMGITQSAGAIGRIAGPSAGGVLFGIASGDPYFCGGALVLVALIVAVVTASGAREQPRRVAS